MMVVAAVVGMGLMGRMTAKATPAAVTQGDAAKYVMSTYEPTPEMELAQGSTTTPIPLPNGPAQVIPPSATPFNTNGMDFTNVTFKVATGYETVTGISGGSLAYIQADADLYSLQNFDIGIGGETALGAFNDGLYSAALDFELIKNLSNFQVVGKLGLGWNFEGDVGGFAELGADLNYNLAAGTGWGFLGNGTDTFTYCGVGVSVQAYKFQVSGNGSTLNKMAKAYVGMAF